MRWPILGLCITLLASGCSRRSDMAEVQELLKAASLAPLPASATNVSYHLWKGVFTAEVCARFQLNADDMRAFLSNSPVLRHTKPRVLDVEHQYLMSGTNTVKDNKHEYLGRHPKWPGWFDPSIRVRGRIYEYYPHWQIIVDEEKNIVWLHTGDWLHSVLPRITEVQFSQRGGRAESESDAWQDNAHGMNALWACAFRTGASNTRPRI
jgi:hypothetical protein